MSNLEYSKWHRQLGYSFFAMDVDYIEIKDNKPVAVIESSLCTKKFPECEGINGVFNRFLSETGGFQLDMAYWVAKWLNVPAFVVCLKSSELNRRGSREGEAIHVLCLATGEERIFNKDEYKMFLNGLPSISDYFPGVELELPDLLETLVKKYPGLKGYPYFKFEYLKNKWVEIYKYRISEIENEVIREKLDDVPYVVQAPVKGETTNTRPKAYEVIREEINREYINLEWVEWRKDFRNQSIGRPAAIIKTALISEETNKVTLSDSLFLEKADEVFQKFKESREYIIWGNISEMLCVDWFFVAYSLDGQQIGPNSNFKVWKKGNINEGQATKLNGYTRFLMTR